MSAEARLRYYASVFDTVEVNSSYYAIPDVRNTVRWVERAPPGFVFHVKAYALLTGHHPKPESLPAELVALLPRQPRRTRRGEIEATSFPPEAVDAAVRLFRAAVRSEEHTSELQSQSNLVCRLLLEKKKKQQTRSARSDVSRVAG